MAADAAPSFADILAAESVYDMPADEMDVRAALDSFGAVFNKRKGDAQDAIRADPHLSPIFSRPFRTTSDMDVQAALASFGAVSKKIATMPTTWMFKQRLLPLLRSPRELPPMLLLPSPIFLRPNLTKLCPPTIRTFALRSTPSVRSSTNE